MSRAHPHYRCSQQIGNLPSRTAASTRSRSEAPDPHAARLDARAMRARAPRGARYRATCLLASSFFFFQHRSWALAMRARSHPPARATRGHLRVPRPIRLIKNQHARRCDRRVRDDRCIAYAHPPRTRHVPALALQRARRAAGARYPTTRRLTAAHSEGKGAWPKRSYGCQWPGDPAAAEAAATRSSANNAALHRRQRAAADAAVRAFLHARRGGGFPAGAR